MDSVSTSAHPDWNGPQRQRLAYLESLLFWQGRFRRREIADRFHVNLNHVTVEIREYDAKYPGQLHYDSRRKVYRPTEKFRPQIMQLGSQDYLRLLQAQAPHLLELLPGIPQLNADALAQLPVVEQNLRNEYLALILRAIHTQSPLSVVYQSLKTPEPKERRIWPQALAHSGFRWHVRVFDERHEAYRDFVLLRMIDVKPVYAESRSLPQDSDWQTLVSVELEPNSAATQGQARVIASEYGMIQTSTGWRVVFPTRKALVPYLLRYFDVGGTNENVMRHPVQLTAESKKVCLPLSFAPTD